MTRASLAFPSGYVGTALLALVALVGLARQARAELVVFQDGSRMEILGFELRGDLVVLRARDGRLLSVPRDSVDLAATETSNRAPDSLSDPVDEALRLMDLRRVTDEIVLAAHRAGMDYSSHERRDARARTLRTALQEGFEAERFYRIAADSFRERSRALAWNEILPWLRSALVQKLDRLSREGSSASSLEEFQTSLASSPPSLSRLELVERLDGAAGTSATAVAMEVALMKTLLAAVTSDLHPSLRLSRPQIEDAAESARPELLAAARARVRLLLLYRYRDVDDRELREYLSFLESRGGRSLGRSLLESLFVAMEDASRRSGALVGPGGGEGEIGKTKI